MPDPVLVSKVRLPSLRASRVRRDKVLRQLSEGIQEGHLLTLVSAPAGYGKTTTVRMWVEEAGYPVAWLTLEKSDNELKQFLTYLLTALGQAEDELGRAALEVVENTPEVDLKRVLGLALNDCYQLDRTVLLVLEEYEQIDNEQIDRVVEAILDQAIAHLHLVITTREDPNLPLTRLRVRNQLTEIRAMDLSFSLEETGEFLASVMRVPLPPEETEILKNRTEGWVAGLQLAALSLRDSGERTKYVEAFRGTHRHVLDYLIEEVLKSQPEAIRDFLRRTSILDELSASLCEAVTGQPASRQYLHDLEHNNLFLVALDEERIWYRYHALFRELLKHQLMQAEPRLVDALHERAANWYEQNGSIHKAVEHAFQIANSNRASELIEKHVFPMLFQGEISTVIAWFGRLPKSFVQSSPILCIGKAWALALMQRQRIRRAEIEQAIQEADDALNRTNADQALRNLIGGHAASIRAYLMQAPTVVREKPKELIEISQTAQRLLPMDEKAIRSVNAMNIGYAYLVLADLPAAERAFQETFEDGMSGGNFYAAIYGPINLILIAMLQGQLKNALRLCDTNIDRFNRSLAGQRFPPIGALEILKGCILLEENNLAEAEPILLQGLSLIRWTGESKAHLKGYTALARLRFIQGDSAGMLENTKALEETRPEAAILAQALRHRLFMGNWTTNKTGLESAHQWATQESVSFDNLTDITGVDAVSEINLRAYLSTAHILARLAVQNPHAYSLSHVHAYFARQEEFAKAHNLVGWLIEIWIVRALLYHVEKQTEEAYRLIQAALSEAAPRGYFRVFVDEADLLLPLLESIEPRLPGDLAVFANRLMEAMPGGCAECRIQAVPEEILSEREREVLRLLAVGESYKEIGQQLFLSLNTVQFHVKNIYSKLFVNKRVQAIEKARELELI